jgi:hypothetical protein
VRDERKIYLPGPPHVKKDGTVRDTLIPTLLITVQVLVQSGTAAPVPVYQATNKGGTVLDLRTQKRQPLCEVRRELLRLCPEDADRFTAELAALLRE